MNLGKRINGIGVRMMEIWIAQGGYLINFKSKK
jgi:hypothetical protein